MIRVYRLTNNSVPVEIRIKKKVNSKQFKKYYLRNGREGKG